MTQTIQPIPEGFHTATPCLVVRDAARALEYYQKAFGASERCRLKTPDGKIGHAEFQIGDSIFMLSDENPGCGSKAPETLGGSPIGLYLYVPDADATFAAAIEAGGKSVMPVTPMFWGDRMGALEDPFGHRWNVATHVEDVDPAELPGRMEAFFASQGG